MKEADGDVVTQVWLVPTAGSQLRWFRFNAMPVRGNQGREIGDAVVTTAAVIGGRPCVGPGRVCVGRADAGTMLLSG